MLTAPASARPGATVTFQASNYAANAPLALYLGTYVSGNALATTTTDGSGAANLVATLPLCDWFLPSLDEAALLSGASEASAILDWCHASGAPLVALKMGADGVWVSSEKVANACPDTGSTPSTLRVPATASELRRSR